MSQEIQTCCCTCEKEKLMSVTKRLPARWIFYTLLFLAGWWGVYTHLSAFSKWFTYFLLNLKQGTHLGSSIEFFVFETPKVMMLLVLVVFGVGVIRSFFIPERTRKILSGKSQSVGNVLAALLGIVTPFCSCSAVPLFIYFGIVAVGIMLVGYLFNLLM